MKYKRVTLICGHYGSGKTNIAINMAYDLKKQYEKTAIADLDIVNPYFRTKDSEKEIKEKGIRLIASAYAGGNLDIPALPADIYAITDEPDMKCILDIGGDDRGAYVLGRIAPALLKEKDYDCLLVVNRFRPLTPDPDSTLEVMREIENAGGMKFTGIINNSNLGEETRPEDVLSSIKYAEEISRLTGLPVVATTAKRDICDILKGRVENLFPLELQKKY